MSEKNVFCYLMLAPALLVTVLPGAYPMIKTIFLSFRSYVLLNVQTRGSEWVGLENYREIMSGERFVQTIFQTVVFTVLAISIVISLSLFLAQIINARFKGRAIVRSLVFIP